jgi:hypothetical protein
MMTVISTGAPRRAAYANSGGISAAFVSTLILVCLACNTVDESRLVGTYRADGSCVTITLVVNPDHSFVQNAETRTRETNRITGRWTVDKKDRTITFRPFLDFLEDMHGRQIEYADFPPETMGWVIDMGPVIVKCPDSDHKVDYVK